jgi:pimeloyl-ACP methyl ester carboxylesterase
MRRTPRNVLMLVALIAAVLGAIVYADYRRDLEAARLRLTGRSQIAITPCGPIEYAIEGNGPPILVVHGAGGGFDQGLMIAEGLTGQGYQAIAMSRFGYLRTPLPADGSAAAQADAHVCLLDALKLDRVAVLGASAGAPSSLQLAIRHPERVSALILLVPAAHLPGAGGAGASPPPGLEAIFNTALRWDFPFWLARRVARATMTRAMLGTPPELLKDASAADRRRVSAMLDSVLPVSARRLGLLNDARVTRNLPRYELERIRVPTLIISARDDLYGTYERAEYTAGEISGARFLGFPSGGHLLVGRQAETTAAILGLLRQ